MTDSGVSKVLLSKCCCICLVLSSVLVSMGVQAKIKLVAIAVCIKLYNPKPLHRTQ